MGRVQASAVRTAGCPTRRLSQLRKKKIVAGTGWVGGWSRVFAREPKGREGARGRKTADCVGKGKATEDYKQETIQSHMLGGEQKKEKEEPFTRQVGHYRLIRGRKQLLKPVRSKVEGIKSQRRQKKERKGAQRGCRGVRHSRRRRGSRCQPVRVEVGGGDSTEEEKRNMGSSSKTKHKQQKGGLGDEKSDREKLARALLIPTN